MPPPRRGGESLAQGEGGLFETHREVLLARERRAQFES
jgi:hypothetical protein